MCIAFKAQMLRCKSSACQTKQKECNKPAPSVSKITSPWVLTIFWSMAPSSKASSSTTPSCHAKAHLNNHIGSHVSSYMIKCHIDLEHVILHDTSWDWLGSQTLSTEKRRKWYGSVPTKTVIRTRTVLSHPCHQKSSRARFGSDKWIPSHLSILVSSKISSSIG